MPTSTHHISHQIDTSFPRKFQSNENINKPMNAIPVIGWIISLTFTISTSIPFWFAWTHFGIGKTYFYWLPEVYQSIPFWNCVGLFLCIGILLRTLTPKFVTVSQSNTNK